jgi:hypothetical protein
LDSRKAGIRARLLELILELAHQTVSLAVAANRREIGRGAT